MNPSPMCDATPKQYDPTIAKVYEVTKGLRVLVKVELHRNEETGQLSLEFTLRQAKIEAKKQRLGKFVLVTNRSDMNSSERFQI